MTTRRLTRFLNGLAGIHIWAVVPLALSVPAWGELEQAQGSELGSGTQLLSVLLSLVLILVLILALGWFLRRFSQGGIFASKGMKVVASLPLGARERLVLVELGGQQILLGVTPQQVRTLHFFETPILEGDERAGSADFREKLLSFMRPGNADKH